jgi:D-arabinose 1-dehydrogenase-like Zn-dependent alcohol dehydrogenase
LFAKDERIVVMSRTTREKADAIKMRATALITTKDVSTVSRPKMLLRVNGHFIRIGVLEDTLPPFGAFSPTAKGVKMGGSAIGSPKEIGQMLKLAAKKRIRIWN